MSAPPPPPPPPPPPGWKPNWREERAKEEKKEEKPPSQPIKIPNSGPQSPKPPVGSGPDGSIGQYDRLPEKLQSTLSKDKKPFTYTPAGIDLSEIKSPKFQKKVNRAKQLGDGPGSPELNEYGQQAPLWPDDIQDITEYCNNPAELDESLTNPRYTGSKIPSRSFKVLQAITATSDDECPSPAFSPKASSRAAPAPPPPPSEFSAPSSYGASSTPFSDYSFAPETSLYTQPTPTYRKVPPPIPPKPPRGVPRESPLSPLSISTPAAPISPGPPSYTPKTYAPPVPQSPIFTPSSFAPPVPPSPVYNPSSSIPPVPPPPTLGYSPSTFGPPPVPPPPSFASRPVYDLQNRQPFSESFYQSTVNPVFKTYTPPPSVRQTVRSGPGFKETTTHKSGPGYEETTTYSTYSSPSYSDGTQTLPLRRESKRSTTKSSFKSQPYYDSPYQTLLDSPQFRDPFSFGGLTPSYSNPYTDQFKYGRSEPLSAPIRNQPFFPSRPSFTQSTPQPTTRQSTTSSSYQKTTRSSGGEDRPLSMTSKFFDEINQMFDQTSANISREMYGTDF